jgi:hypothetical protein
LRQLCSRGGCGGGRRDGSVVWLNEEETLRRIFCGRRIGVCEGRGLWAGLTSVWSLLWSGRSFISIHGVGSSRRLFRKTPSCTEAAVIMVYGWKGFQSCCASVLGLRLPDERRGWGGGRMGWGPAWGRQAGHTADAAAGRDYTYHVGEGSSRPGGSVQHNERNEGEPQC